MNWQNAMEGMRRYLSFVILIFFFQSCTAWPAVTGIFALLSGSESSDGGSEVLALIGGGSGSESEPTSSSPTSETPTTPLLPGTPQNLSYSSFPSAISVNQAISTYTPTFSGNIESCTITPALPSGLSFNNLTCEISGTPTITTTGLSYTITPTNSNGDGETAVLTFSVEALPLVINVTSLKTNGNYSVGENISIQVQFNKNVLVTGLPLLQLSTTSPGITPIQYTTGSTTSTLIFIYTVTNGNSSIDLDYNASSSLQLNGGTIKDSLGNDANLDLPNPGASNSLSANKTIVIDTTNPLISSISPLSNTSVNNVLVSYNLSETCITGSTTWTRISGSPDALSPQIQSWTGSELNTGNHPNIALTNSPTLVDGAVYDISFNCMDLAGNISPTVTANNIGYSPGVLQVISAETLDTNNNGKIDTYKLTFNKPVLDATFPGFSSNSLGSITNAWLIAGYSNVRLIHGTALSFTSDIENDTVIYLRYDENPLECSAATQLGCDTSSKPNLTTTASPLLQDFTNTSIAQIFTASVTESDGARPILVGARSLGATLVDVYFSENVDLASSQLVTNYGITLGVLISSSVRDAVNFNVIHLITSTQIGGTVYTLSANSNITDLSNYSLNNLANSVTFSGLVKPVVSNLVASSATTLTLTFNETIAASSLECGSSLSCSSIFTSGGSLPILSAVSQAGAGINSSVYILTVNPMIEGQYYTLTVQQDTAQSVASSEKIGNTNNSATFQGDGRPSVNISLDTATQCPGFLTANGVARRVVLQYDQAVLQSAVNGADNPANYSITGCITGSDCSSGSPQVNANSVSYLGANKFGIDFLANFDTDNSQYQLTVQNVQDTTSNTIPLPGNLSFQCGNDITPPSLINVTVVTATAGATVLIVNFSESLDSVTGNTNSNYKFDLNAYGFGLNSATIQTNTSNIKLTFTPGLSNGGHQLRVQNVQDLSGNVILDNGINNVQPFIVNAPVGFVGGPVFNDPFADGTPAGSIIIYDGRLYLGADISGSKLFETDFGLTTAQTITMDADGVFGLPYASFNGYNSSFSGCSSLSYPSNCSPKEAVSGVDTIYAACVGGTSTPKMTGAECTAASGEEYFFLGALNTIGYYRSFWYTTTKSSTSTVFPFTEEWSGDAGGAAAYRSSNMLVFKDQLFVNFGAELGGGGRGGRVCMNPSGCLDGTAFKAKVSLANFARIKRIGANGSNSLRNGAYNGVSSYSGSGGDSYVLNAINTMYEYDNDGVGANESQLYLANGGYYTGTLGSARTSNSDGGIVRTVLAYSSRASLPSDCPSNSTGCSTYWEDITPDSNTKWNSYLSIPLPQNSAVTGSSNCGTSLIEMDCVLPYNLVVPSLKAIPYMRAAPNGDLYIIRNACSTTSLCRNGASCDFRTEKQVCPKGSEIPQIWMLPKGTTASPKGGNDWILVAENGTSGKSNMGYANNSHLSLLEFVGNSLYIGYDNAVNGANIWRVDMSSFASGTSPSLAQFQIVNIAGIESGSGGSNQKIFGHSVVQDSGVNWLIIITRDGSSSMKIYRTSNGQN